MESTDLDLRSWMRKPCCQCDAEGDRNEAGILRESEISWIFFTFLWNLREQKVITDSRNDEFARICSEEVQYLWSR